MSDALSRLATPAATLSHGTQVEQSRAVAEVFAAAELAARFPRDEASAEAKMLAACSRASMAKRAEYALPRKGSKDVTGPTVHLARELARIWGNVTHGVVEISRDPDRGQSELMAYAWDVEANARSARTFIVPHTRDKSVWENVNGKNRKVGTTAELIDTQQDITNQNNSVAARQLRETIFSVLPDWYTQDAITRARETRTAIEAGTYPPDPGEAGGREVAAAVKPLRQRAAEAVAAFTANGVTREQLEGWAGAPHGEWTDETLANVGVLFRSLQSGDATVTDVFGPPAAPQPPVTLDELAKPPAGPAAQVQDLPPGAGEADPGPDPDPGAAAALKSWEA